MFLARKLSPESYRSLNALMAVASLFSVLPMVKILHVHTHNRLFSHEVDLDLTGNMVDILEQMTVTSKALFILYLNDY